MTPESDRHQAQYEELHASGHTMARRVLLRTSGLLCVFFALAAGVFAVIDPYHPMATDISATRTAGPPLICLEEAIDEDPYGVVDQYLTGLGETAKISVTAHDLDCDGEGGDEYDGLVYEWYALEGEITPCADPSEADWVGPTEIGEYGLWPWVTVFVTDEGNYEDDEAADRSCSAQISFTIPVPDIRAWYVAEDDEVTPGAFVGLDSVNSISLEVLGDVPASGGQLRLEWTNDAAVDVFTESACTTAVANPTTWAADSMPSVVYVRGDAIGSSTFTLTFVYSGTDFVPGADELTVNVVEAVLNGDGVVDATEATVGAFVGINGDDDNTNTTPDLDDTGAVSGENDLKEFTVGTAGPVLSSGSVVLDWPISPYGKFRVYTDAQKTTPLAVDYTTGSQRNCHVYSVSSLPVNVYVEGAYGGSDTMTATYVHDVPGYGGEPGYYDWIHSDTVKVSVVTVDSILVRRKGSGHEFSASAAISVGGYASGVHNADVRVTLSPIPSGTFRVGVPLTLSNAEAHTGTATKARLTLGSDVLEGDGTEWVDFTDGNTADGIRAGGLRSSNVTRTVSVASSSASASVAIQYDPSGAYDFLFPDYFVPDVADDVDFYPTMDENGGLDEDEDGVAGEGCVDGHTMTFYTGSVRVHYWRFDWSTMTYLDGPNETTIDDIDEQDPEVRYGVRLSSLVLHGSTAETAAGSGIYRNQQTIQDYYSLSGDIEEGIIVLEYDFAVVDDNAYAQ